jgi:hypothetical protein
VAPIAPTLKEKIPRFLSYPITSKEVGDLIVTHAPIFPVQFGFSSGLPLKEGHSKLIPYPILTIRFLYQDIQYPGEVLRRISASLDYPLPRWNIDINAVLKRSRHTIREKLFENGFVEIKSWLAQTRQPSWFQRNHCLTICFHEYQNRLQLSCHDASDR